MYAIASTDKKPGDASSASTALVTTSAAAVSAKPTTAFEVDERDASEGMSDEHNLYRWLCSLLEDATLPATIRVKIIRTILITIQPSPHIHPPAPPQPSNAAVATTATMTTTGSGAAPSIVVTPPTPQPTTSSAAPLPTTAAVSASKPQSAVTPVKPSKDGKDGKDSKDGKDGKDGKDAGKKDSSPPLPSATSLPAKERDSPNDCLDEAYIGWSKSLLRECGGIHSLIKLLTCESEEVASAGFMCLAEIVNSSEENKVFIGDQIGFCQFADTVKRTHIRLTPYVFDVIFDIVTTGLNAQSQSQSQSHSGQTSTPSATASSASTSPTATTATTAPLMNTALHSALARVWYQTVFADTRVLPSIGLTPTIQRLKHPPPLFTAPLSVSESAASSSAFSLSSSINAERKSFGTPTSSSTLMITVPSNNANNMPRSRSEGMYYSVVVLWFMLMIIIPVVVYTLCQCR